MLGKNEAHGCAVEGQISRAIDAMDVPILKKSILTQPSNALGSTSDIEFQAVLAAKFSFIYDPTIEQQSDFRSQKSF